MVKADPNKIWGDYENGKNYKSGENLYNIIAQNERYYAGDQWKGVKSNGLPTPVFNFLEQLVDVKVSTIMANQITIHRRPDDLSEENPNVELAAKAFQEQDKKNWERLKMDNMNEEGLLDAALSGLLVSYWYYDNDIKTGNDFVTQGDFVGELVDSVNLYVSNPNEINIQKQDWIIIAMRKSVAQVRAMAKKYGLKPEQIESIKGDEDVVYEGYDKAQNEQDGTDASTNTTVLLKMWKDTETKTIRFCKTTKEFLFIEEDTELTRYPVAIMPWKLRKRFIYGNAEITYIISNQQHINKMEAMRQLHAQLMAIPKVGYNKNMISGINNQVGGIYPVNIEPGKEIGNAIHYWQPTSMTIDVDKSIENTINKTREFKGVNDNVLGAEKPDNYSAIIAQQRAAGVPLESIKRRFYNYLEDVALIWEDFYKHKYKMTRKLKLETDQMDIDGKPINETIEYIGTNYSDVDLKTSIDVGASTQWSDIVVIQVLDRLLDNKYIDLVEYLERYPKNIIPEQQKLIDAKKEQMQPMQNNNQQYEQMAQFFKTLPPEVQQRIMSLPEQEQENVIMQLMQRGETA